MYVYICFEFITSILNHLYNLIFVPGCAVDKRQFTEAVSGLESDNFVLVNEDVDGALTNICETDISRSLDWEPPR